MYYSKVFEKPPVTATVAVIFVFAVQPCGHDRSRNDPIYVRSSKVAKANKTLIATVAVTGGFSETLPVSMPLNGALGHLDIFVK